MKQGSKRKVILIGHYGVGKTTLALNLAENWATEYQEVVALADLDVNNPYFRVRDWKDKLEASNIKIIMPDEKIAYAEMPVLPKEIYSVIQNKDQHTIIDLGGHHTGTTVLASLAEHINKTPYELWFIINMFRTDMETKEEIKEMYYQLENISKLKITGIVNNTNLAALTEIEDIINSEAVIAGVSKELNVAFLGTAVEESLIGKVRDQLKKEIIPLKLYNPLHF